MENPIVELERRFECAGAISAEEMHDLILQKRIKVLTNFFSQIHQEGILPQEVITGFPNTPFIYNVATLGGESECGLIFYVEHGRQKGFWFSGQGTIGRPIVVGAKVGLDYKTIWQIFSFCANNLHPASRPAMMTYPGIYPVRLTPRIETMTLVSVEEKIPKTKIFAIAAEGVIEAAKNSLHYYGCDSWNPVESLEIFEDEWGWRKIMPVSGSWGSYTRSVQHDGAPETLLVVP